jgi:hypothetical protein
MNTDCGYEEILVKDLLDAAIVRGGVRAIPTEAWTWSSIPVQDPVLRQIVSREFNAPNTNPPNGERRMLNGER